MISKNETDNAAPRAVSAHDNSAVWLTENRTTFAIGPAPYTSPRANEIMVKNAALAINPVDWMTQSIGGLIFPWLKYPFILGSDVAGEVVEVGASVTRFKVGDRVLGHAVGADKSRNSAAEGAFQQYTILIEHMASPIPMAMAYENAVVLPLGLSTAACGLFEKDQLALTYPTIEPKNAGKTLIVWGGSTSVGSNAIQLAIAAGYDVITTASPKNFEYVKRLGAGLVFDYKSATAISDIIRACEGRVIAGALAIGIGSAEACVAIVNMCKGNKFVAMASPSVSFADAPIGRGRTAWLMRTMVRLIGANVPLILKSRVRGIRTKFIIGSSLCANEVGKLIYVDFLPRALADGRFIAAPDPLVAGRGLDQIAVALEVQRRGVSAQKVVVVL